MEYSTILRTEIGFGKDTLKFEKLQEDKKNIKHYQTPADPVATWYSGNPK